MLVITISIKNKFHRMPPLPFFHIAAFLSFKITQRLFSTVRDVSMTIRRRAVGHRNIIFIPDERTKHFFEQPETWTGSFASAVVIVAVVAVVHVVAVVVI